MNNPMGGQDAKAYCKCGERLFWSVFENRWLHSTGKYRDADHQPDVDSDVFWPLPIRRDAFDSTVKYNAVTKERVFNQ